MPLSSEYIGQNPHRWDLFWRRSRLSARDVHKQVKQQSSTQQSRASANTDKTIANVYPGLTVCQALGKEPWHLCRQWLLKVGLISSQLRHHWLQDWLYCPTTLHDTKKRASHSHIKLSHQIAPPPLLQWRWNRGAVEKKIGTNLVCPNPTPPGGREEEFPWEFVLQAGTHSLQSELTPMVQKQTRKNSTPQGEN